MRPFKRSIASGGAAVAVALLAAGCAHIPFVGGDEAEPTARAITGSGDGSTNGSPHARRGNDPLQPGDQIRVSSWREEGIADVFVVDEDGSVVLPLLGPQNVTDRPASELKADLVEAYNAQFRNHSVSVTLMRRVSILGAVNEPGIYHVDPTMTVSEAVALAAGPTEDGKMSKVTILRNGEKLETELDQQTSLSRNVRSGDQIIVPKRNWLSRNSVMLIGTSVSALAIVLTQGIF